MKTIDITPTWTSMVNVFVTLLRDGSPEGQRTAIDELYRMAELADAYVTLKEEKQT